MLIISDAKELVSPPPSPKYSASPDVIRTLNNMKRSFEESSEQKIDDEADKEQVTSGIDSEIMSTAESEPPHKFYIVENSNNGEKVFHGKSPKHKTEMQVFKARSPKHTTMFRVSGPQEKGGSGTDSSDISGVPKSNKHLQCKLPGSMTGEIDQSELSISNQLTNQSTAPCPFITVLVRTLVHLLININI